MGNSGMIAGAFSSTSGLADTVLTTNGDILYYNSGRQRLAKGDNDEVLTLKSGLPSWEAAGGSGNTYARIVKKTDQSVTSSTTMQDDDELVVAISANKTYAFLMFLYLKGNSTGDFKTTFSVPTNVDVNRSKSETNDDWNSGISLRQGDLDGSIVVTISDTQPQVGLSQGRVRVGDTAGNLTLQWAQNTSNGTATTVEQGSLLVLWEETA